TSVLVGSGHAGTELISALEELPRGILLRHYPSVPRDAIRLVLVGSTILPQTATNLAVYTKEQLFGRGIELETARAAAVTADGLTLQDGRLTPSHCGIWTPGNRTNAVVSALGVPKTRDARLKVNEFFEVEVVADADLVLPVRRLARNGFEAWAEVIARDCEGLCRQGRGQRVRERRSGR